jgi:hypothetical protein
MLEPKDCNIGTRVQHIKYDTHEIFDGEIVKIYPAKKVRPKDWWNCSEEERKDFNTFADVKWDGSENSIENINIDELSEPDSELERSFRELSNSVNKQIQDKINMASMYLAEAEALSEETGIPFNSSVSRLEQSYFPGSFPAKFSELEKDFVFNVTNTYSNYDECDGGWEHSAVC